MSRWLFRSLYIFLLSNLSLLPFMNAIELVNAKPFPDELCKYPEKMSAEELKVWVKCLFDYSTEPVSTWEDVWKNDCARINDLHDLVPRGGVRIRAEKLLSEIPRPQQENDVLLAELETRRTEATAGNSAPLCKLLRDLISEGSCTTDGRIFEFARNVIEDERLPPDAGNLAMNALEVMGRIHTESSIHFLEQAVQPEFWRKQPCIQIIEDDETREKAEYAMRMTVAYTLDKLPLDDAIRLTETMYTLWESNPDWGEQIRGILLWGLDRLWQIKKGEYYPRVVVKEKVFGGYGGYGYVRTRYPDWLYGQGGKRIEKPFGDDPEPEKQKEYDKYREYAEMSEKVYEDRWSGRREILMKNCAETVDRQE